MVDLEMEEAQPTVLPVLDGDPRVAPLAHTLGEAGSARASKATALVHGLGAVGTEAARLLMTSGLARVVLVDDARVTRDDLVSQLLLTDADVGRTRSEAVAERLASANEEGATTVVEALQGPLMPSRDVHPGCGFDVVVSTGDDMDAQCALDEACRAAGVAFIFAHAPGLFAFIFVDLGDEHLAGLVS